MIDDKIAVPMVKPSTSFLGFLPAHLRIMPAIRVGIVVVAKAAVMENVPIIKKKTLPAKPEYISAADRMFKNGNITHTKIVVMAMFTASVIHIIRAPTISPNTIMPSWVSPAGGGSNAEITTTKIEITVIAIFFMLNFFADTRVFTSVFILSLLLYPLLAI